MTAHTLECPNCGYDMSAHEPASEQVRCPECGSLASPSVPIWAVPGWRKRELRLMCRWPLRLALAALVLASLVAALAILKGASHRVMAQMTSVLFVAFAGAMLFVGVTLPFLWRTRVALDPRWRRIAREANLLMLGGLGVNVGLLAVMTAVVVVAARYL